MLLALALVLQIAAVESLPDEIVVRNWLVIAPVDTAGRRPFRPDAVFARHLLDPDAAAPAKDETLSGELGKERSWREETAKEDGSLGGEIGWAYASVDSPAERVMMAQLSGASRLFVNGAGFAGDLYAYGFGGVPIALRKGRNDLYVNGVRGPFKLRLWAPKSEIVFADWDVTKFDLVESEPFPSSPQPIGLLFWNATNAPARLTIQAGLDPDEVLRLDDGRVTPPLSPRKTLGELYDPEQIPPRPRKKLVAGRNVPVAVYAHKRDGKVVERFTIELETRAESEARRVTFRSYIDDSAQFYALFAPKELAAHPRVVLSLHGAAVDALGQARSYSRKDDFWIACPTNRRPFGFDWQDWGRADAYEALWTTRELVRLAPNRERVDPIVYVTGHSMGGHGTWHLAANDPDRFVAIAPSAGWSSFDSYGGRADGALKTLWHSADAASNVLALVSNLAQIPTFIVHGTADDNVPVTEARKMQKALEDAGAKPATHYQDGAGHWWDGDAATGADCVDWPAIFDLFRKTSAPKPTLALDFSTVDPSVDSEHFWLQILQPLEYGKLSRVRTAFDEKANLLAVTTENVRRVRITDPPPPWTGKQLTINGMPFAGADRNVELSRTGDAWKRVPFDEGDALREKSPRISGPFKRAFDNRFCLVYGTSGTADENRELLERARYDLETWWYRANGTPDIHSDKDFLATQLDAPRNVILYGNADTNSAWSKLIDSSCPVRAKRGEIALGDREWNGDGLGGVFVWPRTIERKGAKPVRHLVGVFADTGITGTRLGYGLAPFISGVGYPDYALFSTDVLAQGDGGVLAAGWFDHAWKLDGRGYVRADPSSEKR